MSLQSICASFPSQLLTPSFLPEFIHIGKHHTNILLKNINNLFHIKWILNQIPLNYLQVSPTLRKYISPQVVWEDYIFSSNLHTFTNDCGMITVVLNVHLKIFLHLATPPIFTPGECLFYVRETPETGGNLLKIRKKNRPPTLRI